MIPLVQIHSAFIGHHVAYNAWHKGKNEEQETLNTNPVIIYIYIYICIKIHWIETPGHHMHTGEQEKILFYTF